MNLTDRDKESIKAHLDRGEPLPARYKLALFEDAPEVELVWQGKTSEVTNVVLPFQSGWYSKNAPVGPRSCRRISGAGCAFRHAPWAPLESLPLVERIP